MRTASKGVGHMLGYILTSVKDGSRWLHIPHAQVRIAVSSSGAEKWRTHTFHHADEQLQGYNCLGEVSIPEHIATYVVERNRAFREAISIVARINGPQADTDADSALSGVRSLLSGLTARQSKFIPEQEIGQELHALIESAGGP